MFDAYYPNSLRLEQVENLENVMDFKPEYRARFDLDRTEHFEALQAVNLSILLEGLLIYDRIYIDVLEFPLYISKMAAVDLTGTVAILQNGWISFLDMPDVRPFLMPVQGKDTYIWVAAGHAYEKNSAIESIKDGLKRFIKDPYRLQAIEECLPIISKYSKSISGQNYALGKILCDTIDKELKSGCYKSIGIGVLGQYYITKKNENVFFHIGNVICGDMRAQSAGIASVIHTDLQDFFAKQRYVHYNVIPQNFGKVLHLNKIPDFKHEILMGNLTIKNIINLRQTSAFLGFTEWLRSNSNENSDIAQEFVNSIKNPPSGSWKWKWGRLITTTGLGAIPIVGSFIGLGASLVDTVCVDKIIDRREPRVFIENIQKKISKSDDQNNSPKSIVINIDNEITIDNSIEEIENKKRMDQTLKKKIESMQICTSEAGKYEIYLQAMDEYNKYPHPDLTVRFLYLNYLLATDCPQYMIIALHRLDDFLDRPPFLMEGHNLYITAKYYFGSMHNAFINYKKEQSTDKRKFESQTYHCARFIFPDGKIEVLKSNIEELYKRLQREFGI